MPDKPRMYIPIEILSRRDRERILVDVNEEEEPRCVQVEIFSDSPAVHLSLKLDAPAIDQLLQKLSAQRLELAAKNGFQRGVASVIRRKRSS